MFEVTCRCDGCGKELIPTLDLVMKSQTSEVNLRNLVFCDSCAVKIDNALLRVKVDLLTKKVNQ